MCGIVGYYGSRAPQEVIINGLRKLEYRGYDSAGLAILHNGKTKRVRAQGKLKALEEKIISEQFNGHLGIGHTRWATHGKPSERNAHPHTVDGVSLVHNGIIENYLDIREQLIALGAEITSDTDSELVAHLLASEVKVTKDLVKAVGNILEKIRGAFSICAYWEEEPDQLVAFKDGPPLVVGLGKNEAFVASDVQALIQYTKQVVYLEDREVVRLKNGEPTFYSEHLVPIQKKIVELNWSADLVEKQGFSHFMLKEIYEQPRAVASALEPHIDVESKTVKLSGISENLDFDSVFNSVQKIFIVACGTSYYAGLVGKYLIEQMAQVPVEVDIASEFRYRQPVVNKDTLVITISQSGETADTLAAIRLAKEKGATTVSICNVRRSSIDREAHGRMYMNSGPEIGVASTKAFTSTLTVLNVLSVGIAKARNFMSSLDEKKLVEGLLALPSQMESILAYDKFFAEAAGSLKSYKGFLYMGRGSSYPIAMEGALKLKELAYLHAEGYAAGEMKHGPLALIDERMAIIMIAPSDQWYEKTISNLEEARARGGQIISLGTGDNERLKSISEHYLNLPAAHWAHHPILSAMPLQLMAFHLASSLGYDVDQPRNLAKSVTVE